MTNTINLVDATSAQLAAHISPEYAKGFSTNPHMISLSGNATTMQRVIITQFFETKLLVHRKLTGVDVSNVLMTLIPDGRDEDWMKLFVLSVIPFLRDNKVNIT